MTEDVSMPPMKWMRSVPLELSPGLGPCDGDAPELVPVVERVDDAPVGEVPHDQLGDSLQGGLMVERRGELVAGMAQEIEPRLPFGGVGGSGPLRCEEVLALAFGALSLADAAEEGLGVERLTVRIARGRRLLAHPDDAAVTRDQAVLGPHRRAVLRLFELGQDCCAVLGMQ